MSDHQYDKPMGYCSHCGAPLNEYMIGGYRLHTNNEFAVSVMANYHIEYLNKDDDGEYCYP